MIDVIITGGNGWIGKHCYRYLKECCLEIRWIRPFHLTPSRWAFDIQPETHLLHLAWNVDEGYWENPENISWFLATNRLIDNFYSRGGRRAVVAGTCADIGDTLYGKCKRAVRDLLEVYRVTGMSLAYGRIYYLYGPEEKPNRFVPLVINSLLDGKEFTVNHPAQMIDFFHVKDVARSLCEILLSNETGSIDIGSGESITTIRIAQMIGEMIGRPELVKSLNIPTVERVVCNPERLKGIAGDPLYDIRHGLEETIEWWKERRGQ